MQGRTPDPTNTPYSPHLRAIRSAIAALALAVLAVPLLSQGGGELGLWFVAGALLLLAHAFAVPAWDRYESPRSHKS
ncbi:hypothetical protein [Halalkalicoccus tibetensis]|uniref:Uncharacterized protein n=1 Tax=Halalkalicoccus tibetensis TaxID=175632 RepID=A0ABD5V7V3_9EURY